jgi:putative SOS response-associated peptidase YedK
MCYSNSLSANIVQLERTYQKAATPQLDLFSPIYYASGFSFPIWPCITAQDEIVSMHWGLVPVWYRGGEFQAIASKTLNARVESLSEKASFKHLVQANRCIIPSTGFFEFQSHGTQKKPFFIFPKTHSFFHMAGLYDTWVNMSTRESYHSFTIITTEANSMMAEIHNVKKRMPLLVDPSHIQDYLQGSASLASVLPLEEQYMTNHPVQKRILFSTNNNIPEVQAVYNDNIGIQGSLF